MCKNRDRSISNCRAGYATRDDLCKALGDDTKVLYLLAFVLTTNHSDAERCFFSSVDQAFKSSTVFKEWVTCGIRRTLIMSGIATVFGASNRGKHKPDPWFEGQGEIASAVGSITRLADLERFVFVLLFLERYSVHECSLLLGVSAGKIVESLHHALRDLPLATSAHEARRRIAEATESRCQREDAPKSVMRRISTPSESGNS